jgi:hypothetical protein
MFGGNRHLTEGAVYGKRNRQEVPLYQVRQRIYRYQGRQGRYHLLRSADGIEKVVSGQGGFLPWQVNSVKDINVKCAARKYCASRPVPAK